MAKRVVLIAILAASAFLAGGCSTAANLFWWSPDECGERIYGGVRADLGVLQWAGNPQDDDLAVQDVKRQHILAAVDLPLSAIADTLTLPVTIPIAGWRLYSPPPNHFDRSGPGADVTDIDEKTAQ